MHKQVHMLTAFLLLFVLSFCLVESIWSWHIHPRAEVSSNTASVNRRPIRNANNKRRLIRVTIRDNDIFAKGEEESETASYWMGRANVLLERDKNATGAFLALSNVYKIDPTAKGLQRQFERCFRLSIELLILEMNDNNDKKLLVQLVQERMGLAALLIDQERYDDAGKELRLVISSLKSNEKSIGQSLFDKATSMMYRTHAASCNWKNRFQDDSMLVSILNEYRNRLDKQQHNYPRYYHPLPPLHPFEALKWPCISLDDATFIARQYAISAELEANKILSSSMKLNDTNRKSRGAKIKVGYISPDFTATHPLAFLMQNVFQYHNRTIFKVHLYSLVQAELKDNIDINATEVQAIRRGADSFVEIKCTLSSEQEIIKTVVSRIQQDELDVVIDLCGYAGTSTVATIMASIKKIIVPSPILISYMGFPGSSGSSYMDYLIADETTVIIDSSSEMQRSYYTEKIIIMPHCYFVNSHKTALPKSPNVGSISREQYGLQKDSFVFCCHSRPDKIDPITFSSWMNVLSQLNSQDEKRDAVLWLLKSGEEMEQNLRHIAEDYNLSQEALVFCDIVPRTEHLQRLKLADLFLDTPAYNAHTVGCDALYAGVPMVSLLRHSTNLRKGAEEGIVTTDKMASRVGASLLKAVGEMEEFIVPSMHSYENLMMKCVNDPVWFETARQRLRANIEDCPLFDTKRWVKNLERGLVQVVNLSASGLPTTHIVIHDDEPR